MKFSTIMPVYNTGIKLHKSIQSIINQNYDNWELIIINDGSTDDSLNICEEYQKRDSRIKVYTQKNKGPGISRNNGINKCTGDYITFLDSDDYYESDYYLTLYNEIISNNPDVIFINTAMENNDGKIYKIKDISKFRKFSNKDLLKLQMMGSISWATCMKAAKSKIIKNSKFLDIDVGEEAFFSFNVLNQAKKVSFTSKPLYHYVYNDDGQHKKGGNDPWRNVSLIMKKKLKQMNLYNEYEKEINSLALKALSISIYRCSCNLKLKEACKKIKQNINLYKIDFSFKNINKKFIDRNLKFILLLINMRLYSILYFASKIKKNKN